MKMRNSKILGAAALVAACLGLIACENSAAPNGNSAAKVLRTHSGQVVDRLGRVVLVRGMNVVWKTAPYFPPGTAEGFTERDADWLVEHGFNAVRLGVFFSGVMPQPGVIDHGYLDRLDHLFQILADRGIMVQLDMHQDLLGERYSGAGFPDWALIDDGLPHVDLGFPLNYTSAAVGRAFDHIYDNTQGIRDSFNQAWFEVAKRWSRHPALLGYYLLHEPFPGSHASQCFNPAGCPQSDALRLQPFMDAAMASIRAADPVSIVWYIPYLTFTYGSRTYLERPNLEGVDGGHIGISYVSYCQAAYAESFLPGSGGAANQACVTDHELIEINADEATQRMGAPGLIAEFGATDDIAEIERTTVVSEAHFRGWFYSSYKEWDVVRGSGEVLQGEGMFNDNADLESVKTEKLRVLQRTYPMLTAGQPVSLSFDADNGDFSYSYQPDGTDLETEIYLPVETHYPNGFRVEVVNGTWVAQSSEQRLFVKANDPREPVAVTVHARQAQEPGG